MAIRYAITNGNWSSTASWDGFTLPTSIDDVYADGRTITINQSIQVNSLTTRQRVGGTAGGSFLVNNTDGLFITASEIVSGNTNCLTVNLVTGQTINIAADINNATFSTYGAYITGGTTNLTGTVSCGRKLSGSGTHYAMFAQNGVLNMIGNVYGGTPSLSNNAYGLYLSNHNFNLIGDMIGGNGSTNCVGVVTYNNTSIFATGSVIGGPGSSALGLLTYQTNKVIRLNGNIYGGTGSSSYGAQLWQGGLVEIIGNVYGGSGQFSYGLYMGPTPFIGSLSMTGSIYGGSNANAYGALLQSISLTSSITGNIFGGTNNTSNGTPGIWTSGGPMNLIINGTVSSGASTGMRVASTLGTITINGKLLSGLNYGIYHTSTANVIINGTQSNSSSALYVPIYKENGSGNMTINGDILGSTNSSFPSICIVDASTTNLTINGNVINGNFGNAIGLVYLTRTSTLNVNGNVSAGTVANSPAIYTSTTLNTLRINIIGNVTGGSSITNSPAISLSGASTQLLTVTGSVISGSQFPAILAPQFTHKTTVHGNLVNTSDIMAFYGLKLNLGETQSTVWTIQTASASRSISTSNASNGVPSISNVRSGVVYGSGNEFTGTLAVPTASQVSVGVPVDNTVGTAVLHVADVGALLAAYVV
jgi:hypothetical protein